MFGYTGWTELAKVDAVSGTSGILTTTAASSGLTGTWTADLSPYSADYAIMAVLKASNGFASYLLGDDVNGGDWDTVATNTTNPKGKEIFHSLSHFTLYSYECKASDPTCGGGGGGGPLPPVPLPAAGWMLIAGLGGLAAMGRHRKS